MAISKLFIANRGEIAVRIIRAARELGIKTAQAVSEADRNSLAATMADETVDIGPAQAARSYLDIDRVVAAASRCGADAVHPGYGFLSENAGFATAVEAAGLAFVGPSAATIAAMGDKASALAVAAAAQVETVPGSGGIVEDAAAGRRVAAEIGFPIMIKATAGGGGRGIRVAEDEAGFEALFRQASAEAKAAFGEGGLYLERFVARARHVEVQILGDGVEVVHFFERECSVQRRRQKVWEEAPASCLDEATRDALCSSAVRLARAVKYRGAGTVEYLYDADTREFFFIEMNTRIQVEHPVTEMATGFDLVREMLRIAAGERLSVRQEDVAISGHALEARICAEDFAKDFRPSPGSVADYTLASGPGVRFDGLLHQNCTVSPFYDSLIGKLIVWDDSRARALARMERALDETAIEGIRTTLDLHRELVRDPELRNGEVHTRWLDGWLERRRAATRSPAPHGSDETSKPAMERVA